MDIKEALNSYLKNSGSKKRLDTIKSDRLCLMQDYRDTESSVYYICAVLEINKRTITYMVDDEKVGFDVFNSMNDLCEFISGSNRDSLYGYCCSYGSKRGVICG